MQLDAGIFLEQAESLRLFNFHFYQAQASFQKHWGARVSELASILGQKT